MFTKKFRNLAAAAVLVILAFYMVFLNLDKRLDTEQKVAEKKNSTVVVKAGESFTYHSETLGNQVFTVVISEKGLELTSSKAFFTQFKELDGSFVVTKDLKTEFSGPSYMMSVTPQGETLNIKAIYGSLSRQQ